METQTDTTRTPRQRRRNLVSPEQRDAVDVNTTAQLLGVSRRTVYHLIASRELKSIKIRGRRLIPRRAREEFVERLLTEDET